MAGKIHWHRVVWIAVVMWLLCRDYASHETVCNPRKVWTCEP